MSLRTRLSFGRDHRRDGDAARDVEDWHGAEQHYRQHLERSPADTAIWVQLGHAQKEQGRLKDAEASYRKAMTLAPDDADPPLHLGHARKLQGDTAGALDAYQQSYGLAPGLVAASEIEAVGGEAPGRDVPRSATPAVFLAIDDLFLYLDAHKTMSGIQRVIAGVALEILDSDREDVFFCIVSQTRGGGAARALWVVPNERLKSLLAYANGNRVSHDRIHSMIADCKRAATPMTLVPSDTLLVLGAFWVSGYGVRHFVDLKQTGIRLGFYIYDIIPISHPDYCDPLHVREFTIHFCEMLGLADFLFTISAYTARSVAEFIARHELTPTPVRAVPLAQLRLQAKASADEAWPSELDDLRGKDFALYVSTIEGRKNHLYVVNAWRELMNEGVEVPDLVFVGRMGWRVAGLMELVGSSRHLRGKLRIVHDLSDGELDSLYRHCLFTTFTSFVEGWGLPVGESLAHGRPCVASNTASIPEVGGDMVDYVDPLNLREGIGVFRRLITDKRYRAERERKIASGFKARDWRDVTADLFDALGAAARAKPVKSGRLLFAPGSVFRPGRLTGDGVDCDAYARCPAGLMLRDAFYPADDFGAWMRGARQEIRFATGLPKGTEVVVLLRLAATSWAEGCSAVVSLDRRGASKVKLWLDRLDENRVLRLEGEVDADGGCTVSFEVDGEFDAPSPERRQMALGLVGIGYARKSDALERVSVMESLMVV